MRHSRVPSCRERETGVNHTLPRRRPKRFDAIFSFFCRQKWRPCSSLLHSCESKARSRKASSSNCCFSESSKRRRERREKARALSAPFFFSEREALGEKERKVRVEATRSEVRLFFSFFPFHFSVNTPPFRQKLLPPFLAVVSLLARPRRETPKALTTELVLRRGSLPLLPKQKRGQHVCSWRAFIRSSCSSFFTQPRRERKPCRLSTSSRLSTAFWT